ncbi:MAG: hypothetical protein CL840_13575 [Crocinitomicaceae bacterium]|nr:hypothetical protein [Crocinitomicaceae bacterium]|tara:strand:+ start:10945 stop:11658 length:714 start_codon:yes stop_codon:yes gene_type:complete
MKSRIFFIAWFAFAIALTTSAQESERKGVIEVMGTSEMSIAPNQVVFNITVVSKDAEFSKTLDNLNVQVNKLKEALVKAGIMDNDVKTLSYNIHEEYNYEGGQRKLNGHKAIHSMQVKSEMTDERMKAVYNAIRESGVEVQMNMSFTISNTYEYKSELMVLAVNDAKQKAQTLALAAGVELDGIKKISFVQQSRSYASRNMAISPSMDVQRNEANISVNPGDLKLSEQVRVVFYLRQ